MKEKVKNIIIIVLIIVCIFAYKQIDEEENIEIAMQSSIVFFINENLLKINFLIDTIYIMCYD